MVVGHPTGESTDAATGPAVDSGATADSRRICSSSIRARRPARRAPFDLQMPEAPTSVCGPMAGSPAGEIRQYGKAAVITTPPVSPGPPKGSS